jgi:hypothetical protein
MKAVVVGCRSLVAISPVTFFVGTHNEENVLFILLMNDYNENKYLLLIFSPALRIVWGIERANECRTKGNCIVYVYVCASCNGRADFIYLFNWRTASLYQRISVTSSQDNSTRGYSLSEKSRPKSFPLFVALISIKNDSIFNNFDKNGLTHKIWSNFWPRELKYVDLKYANFEKQI